MSSRRIIKINKLVRQQLAEIMNKELSLKPGILITIAKVDTSHDLRYTRVSVSVFPEGETNYAMQTLKKELPKLQRYLFGKLHMKPSPVLVFLVDRTEVEADKVEKILKGLF